MSLYSLCCEFRHERPSEPLGAPIPTSKVSHICSARLAGEERRGRELSREALVHCGVLAGKQLEPCLGTPIAFASKWVAVGRGPGLDW